MVNFCYRDVIDVASGLLPILALFTVFDALAVSKSLYLNSQCKDI